MGKLISELRMSMDSQLYGKIEHIADSEKVSALKRATNHYFDDYNLFIKLGDALSFHLRYHEAIEAYERAILLEPKNPVGIRKRAGRFLTTLNLKRARADFHQYLLMGKQDELDANYMTGLIELMCGDFERAQEYFEISEKLSKNDGEMLIASIYWLAITALSKKDEGLLSRMKERSKEKIYVGHHTAYDVGMQFISGRMTEGEVEEYVDNLSTETLDLELSMIYLALSEYNFYLESEEKGEKYEKLLDKHSAFWPGFAYLYYLSKKRGRELAITHQYKNNIDKKKQDEDKEILAMKKEEKLLEILQRENNFAIAFSGGVDSSYLLYMAKKSGKRFSVYYAKSCFQPQFELSDGQRICEELGVVMKVIELDVLSDGDISKNSENRCYCCKKKIMSAIKEQMEKKGQSMLFDGTIVDDDEAERPGMRAFSELSGVSPLKIAGLTKEEIRFLSKRKGLFTHDKPSYACLATRVQGGDITREKLEKIEASEEFLKALGFSDFRVRLRGERALLQFSKKELERAFSSADEMCNRLNELFDEVAIDLKGR